MYLAKGPVELNVELTPFCNLDCKYCYAYPRRSTYQPNKQQTLKLFDIIFEKIQPFKIIVGGGEPLLRKDFFEIMEKVTTEYEVDWALTTNGSLITKDVAEKLKKIQEKSGMVVQVSLDSHIERIHNSLRGKFKDTLEGIKSLLDGRVLFSIGLVIHKQNIASVRETLCFLKNIGVKHVHMMNIMPSLKALYNYSICYPGEENITKLWDELRKEKENFGMWLDMPFEGETSCEQMIKKKGCLAGITKADIEANGDVIPCSIARNFVLGNLYEQDWAEVWTSEKAREIRGINSPLCYQYLKGIGMNW